MRLLLRRPDLVRSLLLIEPMLAVLLREAGDPLFEEYRSLAQGFIDQARAGRGEAAWALFLDYRNGPGTWAGMSDKSRARFLAQTVQTADGFASNLGNPTTLAECRGIAAPTTIACGTETTVPDRRVAELLRDAVAGNRFAPIPRRRPHVAADPSGGGGADHPGASRRGRRSAGGRIGAARRAEWSRGSPGTSR
jgi:hypothetical protein